MANVRDTRPCGGRRCSHPVVEEFVPSSCWMEGPRSHSLAVDLPGFKKDELKLQVTCSGDLVLSGERKVHEEKTVHVEKTFEVPKNADIDKTTGKFSGGILSVTVPKQVVDEKRNVWFCDQDQITKDLKNTNSENVVEMLQRNKGIVMTAILAFSLGVLVTVRKLESSTSGN
ncbi:hypothetical protein I3843_11G038800 [Carya illinoinensis]|uniref:SHSP domain-containing protein n=1 Tax=Carya illinoinensis TaxID=32201 RepID=A0A8T1NZ32_CARIL|nr:hypothetical protein CIPAW_11G038900 [Carya illinoinensis]KAG7954798.1 hypothetical protein I3843_11G038800 [Carya illinoinensis]